MKKNAPMIWDLGGPCSLPRGGKDQIEQENIKQPNRPNSSFRSNLQLIFDIGVTFRN